MLSFKRLKLAIALLGAVGLGFFPGVALAQSLMVTISGDIALGTWTGSGDKQSAVGVCIYSEAGSNYSITATGNGGTFTLTGGSGSIAYGVGFSDTGIPGAYGELSHGSARSFSGADESSTNCGGASNAAVRVTVTEAALGAAAPGNYSATLTLVLTAS